MILPHKYEDRINLNNKSTCSALVVDATASVAPPANTPHKYEECVNWGIMSLCAALVVDATASVAPPTTPTSSGTTALI